MSELTEVEKKWFESLKRCLNRMPPSCEILVQEITCDSSDIHIFKKGDVCRSMSEADDLMMYDPSKTSMAHFRLNDAMANNHGY